jgi:hypothetical protein
LERAAVVYTVTFLATPWLITVSPSSQLRSAPETTMSACTAPIIPVFTKTVGKTTTRGFASYHREKKVCIQVHAGQDATVYQIMERVRPGCVLYVSFLVYFCTLIYLNFRRRAFRIRDDRVQKVVDSWQRQMPSLVDAYLRYKSEGTVSSEAVEGGWEITVMGFDGMYQRSRI